MKSIQCLYINRDLPYKPFAIWIRVVRIFPFAILFCQAVVAEAQQSITFSWDWAPGDSEYTSGPNGDIAYVEDYS